MKPLYGRRTNQGFTLLEMLVVVAIMATVALSALSLVGDADGQARYDASRERLLQIRTALLGAPTAAGAPERLAGYIADQGVPPANLAALAAPAATHALLAPVFDPSPGPGLSCPDPLAGLNNGGLELPLSGTDQTLAKGGRGAYLAAWPGEERFRDGWGNRDGVPANDALNFGWAWAESPSQLSIASLGADNAPGSIPVPGEIDYGVDQVLRIAGGDWQVPIAGWTVKLRIDNPAALAPGERLGLSLLIYEAGSWRRLSTAMSTVPATPYAPGQLLSFHFDAANLACRSYAPYGEHLLVAFKEGAGGDGTAHSGDDEAVIAGTRVRLWPRSLPPEITLSLP